jgi:hypothetical protein
MLGITQLPKICCQREKYARGKVLIWSSQHLSTFSAPQQLSTFSATLGVDGSAVLIRIEDHFSLL